MSSGIVSTDSLVRVEGEMVPTEKEIHHQTVFLSNPVRSKRKSLPPIFSLPPEILEIIFIYGARDYHYYESWVGDSIPTWVNVSYVCRHWRNVALGCPTLWTYHFALSLCWTEELLLRSKQAPLKIQLFLYNEVFRQGQATILDNLLRHSLDRIQELCLDVLVSVLPPMISLRAPRLEVLKIHLDKQHSPHIIDGDTPGLKVLWLSRCLLPLSSLNLSRLKLLAICKVRLFLLSDIIEFFSALGSMQDLTALALSEFIPDFSFSVGALGVFPKIDLPRLEVLFLDTSLSTVIAFFSCVNIPLEARLVLELGLEVGSRDAVAADYAQMSSLLAQRYSIADPLSSSSGPIFRSLMIDCDDNHTGIACTWIFSSSERYKFNSLPDGSDSNFPLQVSMRKVLKQSEDNPYRIMLDICRSLPLTGVQTLYGFHFSLYYAIDYWREILGCMGGLRYLEIRGGWLPVTSLRCLASHETKEDPGAQLIHDRDPTSGRTLVPALEELVLINIFLKHYGPGYWCAKSNLQGIRVTMIDVDHIMDT